MSNPTYSTTVYTRARWANNWTLVPYLYADHVTEAVAPVISSAKLSYRFAPEVMRPDAAAFAAFSKLTAVGYYVKIVIDQPGDDIIWYGVIVEDSQDRHGEYENNEVAGKQMLTAYGLEFLLERQIVGTSAVENYSAGEQTIQRGIGFNLGPGQDHSGDYVPNRSNGFGNEGTNIFASNLGDASTWTARTAINYLLAYHGPRDATGTRQLPFYLYTNSATSGLEYIIPTLPTHGKTVWSLLNELIDRRRAYGFRLVVDDATEDVYVTPFTFTSVAIPLVTTAGEIPANTAASWEIINDPTAERLDIGESLTHIYDQVIVRGERRGSVFTLHESWGNVEKDWSDSLEDAYNTGASDDAGYAALDSWEKQAINRLYRQQPKFETVFSRFRVPPDWDGYANSQYVFPAQVTGDPIEPFWYPGLRFENYLPLLSGHDYSGSKIGSNAVTDDTLDESKAEPLRPFAIIYDPTTGKYAFTQKNIAYNRYEEEVSDSNGREWAISLRMQNDQMGIVLDVHGAPQHKIALDEFDASDTDGPDDTDYKADLRWQDVYATVYLLGDSRAEGKCSRSDIELSDQDDIRKLIIHIRGAHLDYVVPGTVVGIDKAGDKVTSNGGYIRDDRERLRELAAIAYAWYSEERRPLVASLRRLNVEITLGTLISGIGSADVLNTVITQIDLDFLTQTQTVQTAYAELDVSRL